MGDQKDEVSEITESEDLPSDFFDDFNRVEFMEGLSVIDEWDETKRMKRDSRTRIDAQALDSVKDLRELIDNDSMKNKPNTKYAYDKNKRRDSSKSPHESDLDSFIKPGSRRDPNKTNEAIKKDKEVKVQQYLAKTLESSDELRPPGTELDDYYEEDKKKKEILQQQKNSPQRLEHLQSPQRTRRPRPSPRLRISPHARLSPRQRQRSPRPRLQQRPRFSPSRSPQRAYQRRQFSPFKSSRRNASPQRRNAVPQNPVRRSPRRYSPGRRSQRHSPGRSLRRSPRRSPRRQHRSRSPRRRPDSSRAYSRSRSRSPRRDDSFLYPNPAEAAPCYPVAEPPYQPELAHQYAPPVHSEYPGNFPAYPYPQAPAYGGGFSNPYNYGVPQDSLINEPSPMPINPMPDVNPALPNPVLAPPVVPANTAGDKATPYDALAQLVAEGKISQEDYLKLTPNKGQASTAMDTKTRVLVLTRCTQAISKLDKLLLPNRLVINTLTNGAVEKSLAPKYCSPLKRQVVTEFNFAKGSSPEQQTKQLVESIISTLGLDRIVSKYKKKLPKNMKDAVVQTSKLHCEVCEIRESTKYQDVGTSTEPEYFTSTVHTQVVEQDLMKSKSIFNPSGSVGEGSAISIAHLTPAQLVSQLAARAKTLKQPQDHLPPNQFSRRPPGNYDYDYDNRGDHQQYHPSYNNYNRY